jgi:hypothetical protein
MSFERKVYLVSLVGCASVGLGALVMLYWMWSIGAPASLLLGLSLGIVGNLLVGYMAWRALNGTRPVEGDPISIALKVLRVGIFLSLFGPCIWAALNR